MLLTVSLLVLFGSVPVVTAALAFLPAPYGRYSTRGWGPTLNARLGWILMELPAFAVIAFTLLITGRAVALSAIILLACWEAHYVYRTFIFPFLIREQGKQFPVSLLAMAVIFNSLNGYANGVSLARVPPLLSGGWLQDTRFALGLALFVGGFVLHVWSDSVLRNLRAPGETGYKIPRGGLFELVASPNYLGEVMEWCGWALATWSPAGLAFALFTMANLVPRAHAHRKWYRATFPDYPASRKRILPFLF
jgi:protein-S-isoprenylcysteine O-methyltransferase Ste14